MPSTHIALYVHLVFSTKNRRPIIGVHWQSRLHAYLGGTVRGLGGIAEAVGGIEDHVHLLVSLKAPHRLGDFTRCLKGDSSRWVHTELRVRDFQWQEGYGAFSIGTSSLEAVKRYIQNQREHHRNETFQEEYREFLQENHISYDERYLW